MFALALWDRQDRQLVLARDRLGEKPLYYGWFRGNFLFASELHALRRYPGFDAPVDPAALAGLSAPRRGAGAAVDPSGHPQAAARHAAAPVAR